MARRERLFPDECQVNQAVTQIDQITQQNAALVEEATAAAKSLQDQAEALVHAVAIFKLTDEQNAAKTARPGWHARRKNRPALIGLGVKSQAATQL